MRLRRLLSLAASVMLVCALGSMSAFAAGTSFDDGHYKYFYNQLGNAKNSPDASQKIYQAMEKMLADGTMKDGGSIDLMDGYISESLVKKHIAGENDLVIAIENARDAFYMDYPEVFYIDMEKLSVRITRSGDGSYHVWLGQGNNETYMIDGFNGASDVSSAESALNSKIDAIVNAAASKGAVKDQIESVYQQVMASTEYKLDDECAVENRGHIRTPYGPLVKGQSVCEGYSKSVKACLDKLGIPCVLVRGTYNHSKTAAATNVERHMWCYAQVDGEWYALDATFDDDDSSAGLRDFFLVGQAVMDQAHYADGVMSAPEVEFAYPELSYDGFGTKKMHSENGLEISYGKVSEDRIVWDPLDDVTQIDAGRFFLSYNGMNATEARKAGYHFLVKYYDNDPKTGEIYTDNTWYYIYPQGETAAEKKDAELWRGRPGTVATDLEHVSYIGGLSHIPYLAFAVTKDPIDPLWKKDTSQATSIEQLKEIYNAMKWRNGSADDQDLIVKTGVLENFDGNYLPAPYPTKTNPYIGTKLTKGKKIHVSVTYGSEMLVPSGDAAPFIATVTDYRTGTIDTDNKNASVTNLTLVNETTGESFNVSKGDAVADAPGIYRVEFDFVPSEMWADDSVVYYFYLEGMKGQYSDKRPSPAYYCCQTSLGCTYSMKTSGKWRAYARPTLIASNDMSVDGWKTADGQSIDASLTDRMALVVSNPTYKEKEGMDAAIENHSDAAVLKTEVYNIDLTFCSKNVVIPDGHHVTAYLGFPAGYGPDDAGVTFKAYHFKTVDGKPVVEEIPCVVTPYGLLVTCTSFSPFAVAVVEDDGSQQDAAKSVAITDGDNGVIEGLEGSVVTLKSGQSKTFKVKANDGYVIDSLNVFGMNMDSAAGSKTAEFTIDYAGIPADNNLISVNFVPESVVAEEQDRGESTVVQFDSAYLENAQVTLSTAAYTYNGKAKKPSVKVVAGGVTLKSGTDYTVSYKNNVKVGKPTVTVTGKGAYQGTSTVTFKIVPKGTSISKVTAGKKKATVKWKKQSTQTSGYCIMYSTSSKFSSYKLAWVSGAKKTSYTVKSLTAKKKYYVKVCTYKTVNGVKICSAWSKVKTVKVK